MVRSPVVDALLCASAYPDKASEIELVQTHISNVFLLAEVVYKIKKPVDFGFLDFSTLERRRFFCLEEVRLNSRLAPDIYLGVVPVFRTESGGEEVFSVGSDFIEAEGERGSECAVPTGGEVVEYAVKMRRIDASTILDVVIREGRVSEDMIRRVAHAIAAFHKKAEPLYKDDQVDTIAFNVMDNFTRIESFVGDGPGATITQRRLIELRDFSESFLSENRELLQARVSGGFIRDCHGDMHVDHVVVTDVVAIFDCIEFSERLRCCDVVADAAFLSMDLEYLGRGDLAKVFEQAYKEASCDDAPASLWNFYKCYRAVVRGKVASLRLGGGDIDRRERQAAVRDAVGHFHLAALSAKGGFRPALIIVAGLTATGKSTLVGALTGAGSMKVISTDAVRRDIFNIPKGEHRRGEFGKDLYTEEAVAMVYEAVFREAEGCLRSGRSVIIDATFSKKKYIVRARDIAAKTNALCFVIECLASDETVKVRMVKRLKEKDCLSDATYETYQKMKEGFEPIEGASLRVDTDDVPAVVAELVIKQVFGGGL